MGREDEPTKGTSVTDVIDRDNVLPFVQHPRKFLGALLVDLSDRLEYRSSENCSERSRTTRRSAWTAKACLVACCSAFVEHTCRSRRSVSNVSTCSFANCSTCSVSARPVAWHCSRSPCK